MPEKGSKRQPAPGSSPSPPPPCSCEGCDQPTHTTPGRPGAWPPGPADYDLRTSRPTYGHDDGERDGETYPFCSKVQAVAITIHRSASSRSRVHHVSGFPAACIHGSAARPGQRPRVRVCFLAIGARQTCMLTIFFFPGGVMDGSQASIEGTGAESKCTSPSLPAPA